MGCSPRSSQCRSRQQTLDIPLETLLSPRGNLCARYERDLPGFEAFIESARRYELPTTDEDHVDLVRTVLEVRDAVLYHQLE